MATFNIRKHVKVSIALEIIFDNGYGARRGLSEKEILVLDADNTVLAILPLHDDTEDSDGWSFVVRADIVREFSKLGVVLR